MILWEGFSKNLLFKWVNQLFLGPFLGGQNKIFITGWQPEIWGIYPKLA